MPAWFGPPSLPPPDHGGPLPFVDPEPTQMWKNEVFKPGDCVTFQDTYGKEWKGVVEDFEVTFTGQQARRRLVVKTTDGVLHSVMPALADRCSLLEVLAEASQ